MANSAMLHRVQRADGAKRFADCLATYGAEVQFSAPDSTFHQRYNDEEPKTAKGLLLWESAGNDPQE